MQIGVIYDRLSGNLKRWIVPDSGDEWELDQIIVSPDEGFVTMFSHQMPDGFPSEENIRSELTRMLGIVAQDTPFDGMPTLSIPDPVNGNPER